MLTVIIVINTFWLHMYYTGTTIARPLTSDKIALKARKIFKKRDSYSTNTIVTRYTYGLNKIFEQDVKVLFS